MTGKNSLQERFHAALKSPPLEIYERLEREGNEIIWVMGTGTERIGEKFQTDEVAYQKLFLCDPGMEEDRRNQLKEKGTDLPETSSFTVFSSNCLERLGAFPNGTFQIGIATWLVGTVPADDLLELLLRMVEPGGQIGILAMKDGTPELPLSIFKDAVREVTGRRTDMQSRGFLTDPNSVRDQLFDTGFRQERAWENSVFISFQSSEEVFSIIQKSIGSAMPDELKNDIQEVRNLFCSRLEDELGASPEIEYHYVGAVAKHPG